MRPERLRTASGSSRADGRSSGKGGVGEITAETTIVRAIRDTVSPDTEVIYDRQGRFDLADVAGPLTCLGIVGELPYAEGISHEGEPELLSSDRDIQGR